MGEKGELERDDLLRIIKFQDNELKIMLKELNTSYGCVAFKLGTEGEAYSYEQLYRFTKLANGIMPVLVKIGGVDARNDIMECLDIGVDGLIAPMVESPYGVINFIGALRVIAAENFDALDKGLMIESIQGYNNLDKILQTPDIKYINHITVGRGDLANSIGKYLSDGSINMLDDDVIRMSAEITRKAQAKGIIVSVGGRYAPSDAPIVVEKTKPDRINTFRLVFNVRDCPDLSKAVKKGIEFYNGLLRNEEEKLKRRYELLKKGIVSLEKYMK